MDIFARLLREALWAPLAILCLSVVLGPVLAAQDLWWLVHVAGGAALGFCYLRASRIALRNVRPAAAYVVAFTATCSTALGWEMLEFTSDQVFGTALQEGLLDTMSDLMLGVAGAAGYLAWHALIASAGRGGR